MQGYDVLHPMGFDAFGLPAEQYALKNKVNPNISTAKNVARYKAQLQMLGLNYDWEREVNTTDPKFYKWTQWMWKQMYKKGLAYESYDPIVWCPSCKTGLANEDLEDGKCERCGSDVEKKPLRQWTIRITDYAKRLVDDLDKLNWEPHIKELQRNWIGLSEGSEIDFRVETTGTKLDAKFTVFTTRADTLFGCTYCVLAPEHALVERFLTEGVITNGNEVKKYQEEVKKKTDIDRSAEGKEKTGVKLEGIFAVNPVNNEQVPVFIADYVLPQYGTGAIMAVPAHDERDYEFAIKYNLNIQDVVAESFGKSLPEAKDVEGVVVVVYNKTKDKYLKLLNTVSNEAWLVGGGKEGEETFQESALRELQEEAGYVDPESFIQVGGPILSYYYNNLKKSNRRSLGYSFFAVVTDEKFVGTSHEVHEHYKTEWVTLDELIHSISKTEGGVDHWLEILKRVKNEEYKTVSSCDGVLINSEEFTGLTSEEARKKITEKVGGKIVTKTKLRDWVFARQRYWGEPFPIVFDENHKSYAVTDSELPVELPMVDAYEPTGTGESPLATIKDWVEVYGYINEEGEFVSCDKGDEKAKLFRRETNTMPQWAGSSWYYLRYIDPKNDTVFADKEKEKKWSPVDFYVGGAEHATRHLIYARFWHKFLYDLGYVHYDEPFTKLQTVGLIIAEDGRKMSKRWGNIVNPDEIIHEYGADTLRMYEMFMGPFDQAVAWSTKGVQGVKRFLDRFVRLGESLKEGVLLSKENETLLHQTVKKVGEDIESFKFNTAVSSLMILLNALEKEEGVAREVYRTTVLLIAPFAPHLAEELWEMYGFKEGDRSIHEEKWPSYDVEKLTLDTVVYAVQVNGKLRGELEAKRDENEEILKNALKSSEIYKKYVHESEPKKLIIIKNKIINIVI
jgi:leucyl-tRNA synthetase